MGEHWIANGTPQNLSNTTIANVSGVDYAAIAAAVWSTVSEVASTESGTINLTTLGALRLISNLLGGTVVVFTENQLIFKSLDGSKIRATITHDSTGRLTFAAGDMT